jgi:uncharacterized repeat protein (TIGR01451 family)
MPGSYVLLTDYVNMGNNIAPTCPSSGSLTLSTYFGGTITQNFAYQCATPTSLDMSVSLASTAFTAGHDAWMWIGAGDWFWFSHFDCTPLSATVTLTLDSRLSYVTYAPIWGPGPSSVSGSTITWNISTVGDLYGLSSQILVHAPSTLLLTDTLCNTLHVTPTSLTDPDLTNNTIYDCRPVGVSYDPNGKSVSPAGFGPQGYIHNGTPLTYLIHFQNTGTAAASNITVVDTLDNNLDLKTLHVLHSSSPVLVYEDGNKVKFKFNNINLPDATADPEGSTGAIAYEIKPKNSLAPGTQIRNRAGIYFDYNPVVMTNGTLNTIEATTGVQVAPTMPAATIYPNPATEEFTIHAPGNVYSTYTVTNMLGETLLAGDIGGARTGVNAHSLPAGIYTVRLRGAESVQTMKLEKL